MTLRVAILTLGCKVNQVESAALDNAFRAAGCALVDARKQADLYIINTCAVTGRAGQQSRQSIRAALRRNPEARILVTGCYAQAEADSIRQIDPRLLVIGNSHKEQLVAAALGQIPAPLPLPMTEKKDVFALPVQHFPGHTRAFLRVQDGCNNFCSYCIVPYTRGRSRSLPKAQVLQQTALFAKAGYREIVVTGINVGRYGLDLKEGETLVSLLTRLCADFPGIRFRLSSVEPTEVEEVFLDFARTTPNFMPHFHLPLQSGEDRILALMGRRYRTADFAEKLHLLHERFPLAGIGCDVLTGFPGETELEAARTRAFLESLPVSFLHVFPYSKRPGTRAAALPGHLPQSVKAERAALLHELDARLRRRFYATNLGRRVQVLAERSLKPGLLEGFSENYLPVRFAGPETLINSVAAVRLTAADEQGVLGELATGA